MQKIEKFSITALAAAAALAMTAVASFADGAFEGAWNVADTAGKTFEITLANDGTAKANRVGGPATGTWTVEGSSAVITWNTGWTTKIAKAGDTYTKTAFKKGEPLDGKPTNSSTAEKTK
jgi:hypothetical protein